MNPPKPLDIKLLTGNPGRHRLKEPATPDRPAEPPPPPDSLDAEGKRLWVTIAPALTKAGTLAEVDYLMLEQLCLLGSLAAQCRMEIATKGMSVSPRLSAPRQSPALRTLLQILPQIKSYAEALGIGAVARGRASVLLDPQPDLFSRLFENDDGGFDQIDQRPGGQGEDDEEPRS